MNYSQISGWHEPNSDWPCPGPAAAAAWCTPPRCTPWTWGWSTPCSGSSPTLYIAFRTSPAPESADDIHFWACSTCVGMCACVYVYQFTELYVHTVTFRSLVVPCSNRIPCKCTYIIVLERLAQSLYCLHANLCRYKVICFQKSLCHPWSFSVKSGESSAQVGPHHLSTFKRLPNCQAVTR